MQKARRFSVLLAMAVIFIAFDRRLPPKSLSPLKFLAIAPSRKASRLVPTALCI